MEKNQAEAVKQDGEIRGEIQKNKQTMRKVMQILGYVICAALLAVGSLVVYQVVRLKMLPKKYVIIMICVMAVVLLALVIVQRWLVAGIIAKIIAIAAIVIGVIAINYVDYTYNRISKAAGIKTKIDNVNIYALAEDPANSIDDVIQDEFGVLSTLDRANTDEVVAGLEEEYDSSVSITEYETVPELVKALYEGQVRSIIMNSAYVGVVVDSEEYADYEQHTKILKSAEIETEIEEAEIVEEYLYSGDRIFTVYISGIDTRGTSPKVNSRSDVNILLTANMDTRQILLISTPRDYYVPLSISNGVKDKLTHAGNYGVNVSMDTLAMLYGVNIDDYMKINFTGFVDVVEELGGVDVVSDYDFSTGKNHYVKGVNHLNGEQALAFARERYSFPDGDRQRGRNQMAVIEAVIKKLATSETLYNYKDILESVTDCMVTSMTYDEIADIVQFQLEDMKGWDVIKYSVTGYDSSNTTYSAGSQMLYVMVPDESTVEQAKEYLEKIYNNERIAAQ